MSTILSLLALIAACATTGQQPPAPPTGVQWNLVELEGAPALGSPGGQQAHVRFETEGARVAGFTTCNRFFGTYEAASGGRVRFSELGSTKMACVEPERARQEQRFMSVLHRADRFTVSGDTLTLYENDRPLARFAAGP